MGVSSAIISTQPFLLQGTWRYQSAIAIHTPQSLLWETLWRTNRIADAVLFPLQPSSKLREHPGWQPQPAEYHGTTAGCQRRLVQAIKLTGYNQQFNVAPLAKGMYLLKFADGSVLRFVKQ